MTADFYKSIYQKKYLPNNFRLMILGNKKVLEKSQIGWTQVLVPILLSRHKDLVIAVKNCTEPVVEVTSFELINYYHERLEERVALL